MKKLLAMLMTLSLTFALAACGAEKNSADDADVKSEGVMTYEEYAAAELDTEVVVETYVQAKQGWWDNKYRITLIKIKNYRPDGR